MIIVGCPSAGGHPFKTRINMLKKTSFTLLSCLCGVVMCLSCGCSSSDGDSSSSSITVSISPSTLSFDCTGGSDKVTITSNQEWGATVSDDWISVSPTYSTASSATMTVTIAANTSSSERTGTVAVKAGSTREVLTITQAGDETADEITCFLDGYSLVWNDEFDDGTVLGNDWTHEVQSAYWVNSELQYYVNGQAYGTRVTELVNGKLNITCFKEASTGNVYSARVYAKVKEGWTYGYFEASILLPQGKGTWPAWWMMPVNYDSSTNPWPGCGEIDIMEEVGYNANYVSSTIHCNKYNNGGTAKEHVEKYISTAQSEYHKYGCEWTSEYLKFYYDEELVLTYANDGTGTDAWPFDEAFYPILNLAWGGSWGGAQGVDESALPATMKVEYVRVFQKD